MTRIQELQIKMSEMRSKLNDTISKRNEGGELSDELRAEMSNATKTLEGLEVEYRAAVAAEGDETREVVDQPDAEARELKRIEERSEFSNYIVAALENRSVDGAEKELNAALGMGANKFPLQFLTRGLTEDRAAIDGDTSTKPNAWLDRLFYGSHAARLGISFPSVPAGVSSYPVTTGGPSGVQRGRTEAISDGTFAFSVSELKPTRHALSMTYSIEDSARVPGLADAIQRDMRAALVESIDNTIFKGDAGGSGTEADIVGLQTASIDESTLTQANKVKGDKVLEKYVDMIDGKYAESMGDISIVNSVGSTRLWLKTIQNAATENQTIAQFLGASGLSWGTKGGIDEATANGDFGAYIGLGRGMSGAGVAPVWMGAELINDRFTGAKKGEVVLTLSYLWNLGLPRTANFKRIKYVA